MADLQTDDSTDLLAPAAGPDAFEAGLADAARRSAAALVHQVSQVVLGNPEPIRLAVTAFLAGGHVLVEDIPGVGKTLLAKALARSIGGDFGRVQGTADLLPSDVSGVSVYEPNAGTWSFRAGPVFNNVVLFDELNRATPRTQSALLEAMAEGQVTVDGLTRELPVPFFVIATQNPHGDLGTFPLVQGQRDRFAMVLSLGVIAPDVERQLLRGQGGTPALEHLEPVIDLDRWSDLVTGIDSVYVNDAIVDYILSVAAAVRHHPEGQGSVSPRASLVLLRTARAYAITHDRDYVEPDDVKAVVIPVLAHRIGDSAAVDLARSTAILHEIIANVPVPPPPG
jgi:MoxR-like ATPase